MINEPSTIDSPHELLKLATGYQRSKTLFALVELNIPTLLARRSLPLIEIANQTKLHRVAADRLLNAGVALGLLELVDGEYRNTALTERYLVKDKQTFLGDLLTKYDQTSYPLWNDLTNKLREWQPGATDDQTPQDEDQGSESMKAQHNLALLVGQALGQAYDFSRHHTLLDLGGGTGAMSLGICASHPELHAIIYDLGPVAQAARDYVNASGMADRIEIREGNFKEDKLPEGFDVVLLANLLSVASEQTNRELLSRLYQQLPIGGACLLSGWILDDTRTSPLIPVLFCLEDINWQAPDVERSAATYIKWLEACGFTNIERQIYYPPTSLIVGKKNERESF